MKSINLFSLFSSFSLVTYLIFIIYAPYLQVFFPLAKQVVFFTACIFAPFIFIQPYFRKKLFFIDNKLLIFLLFYPFFLIVVNLFFETGGMGEISTFLSIYFVLAAIIDRSSFFFILKFAILINLYFLIYEFINKSYIYEDLYNMSGELIRSLDISSYGEVGFRPKGLFTGPLDATSFIIFSAILFRKNNLFLILCLASALITGGRLVLIVCVILLVSRSKIDLKTTSIILLAAICTFIFLSNIQDYAAVSNLLEVFDINSPSNQGRIVYTLAGIEHLIRSDLFGLLFGSSLSFLNFTDGHSAESGFVSMIIVHGLFGLLYLLVIFSGLSNSLKRNFLVLLIAFLCLSIYRFDAGFMRSFFLYYILLYASKESFNDRFG